VRVRCMNSFRSLVQLLGALGLVVLCVVVGTVGSCIAAGSGPNGIPGAGPGANQAMLIGGVLGLAVGVGAAIYYFRR
jgi:hypothetical protein